MALISTTLIKFRVNFTYVIFKDKNIFLTFFYLSEKTSYYIITTVLSCSTTSLASISSSLSSMSSARIPFKMYLKHRYSRHQPDMTRTFKLWCIIDFTKCFFLLFAERLVVCICSTTVSLLVKFDFSLLTSQSR